MTDPHTPKTCTLIGSNKGGIGKSFIATLYISAHGALRQNRLKAGDQMDPLVVIEIDNEAKLHATMKERVNFSLRAAPDLSAISRDRRAMERYFNPVFQWWCVGDSLTDLGANVTTPIFDWMRTTAVPELAAERNIHFRFLAVAIPDAQSLKSARQAVEMVVDTLGSQVTPVLVFNDMWGIDYTSGFAPYQDNPDLLELENYRREGRLMRVDVPFCDSQLMEYGRAHNLSVLDVWQREAQIARELGLDDLSQRTEKRRLMEWLVEVQKDFAPLFDRTAPLADTSVPVQREQAAPAAQAQPQTQVQAPPPAHITPARDGLRPRVEPRFTQPDRGPEPRGGLAA